LNDAEANASVQIVLLKHTVHGALQRSGHAAIAAAAEAAARAEADASAQAAELRHEIRAANEEELRNSHEATEAMLEAKKYAHAQASKALNDAEANTSVQMALLKHSMHGAFQRLGHVAIAEAAEAAARAEANASAQAAELRHEIRNAEEEELRHSREAEVNASIQTTEAMFEAKNYAHAQASKALNDAEANASVQVALLEHSMHGALQRLGHVATAEEAEAVAKAEATASAQASELRHEIRTAKEEELRHSHEAEVNVSIKTTETKKYAHAQASTALDDAKVDASAQVARLRLSLRGALQHAGHVATAAAAVATARAEANATAQATELRQEIRLAREQELRHSHEAEVNASMQMAEVMLKAKQYAQAEASGAVDKAESHAKVDIHRLRHDVNRTRMQTERLQHEQVVLKDRQQKDESGLSANSSSIEDLAHVLEHLQALMPLLAGRQHRDEAATLANNQSMAVLLHDLTALQKRLPEVEQDQQRDEIVSKAHNSTLAAIASRLVCLEATQLPALEARVQRLEAALLHVEEVSRVVPPDRHHVNRSVESAQLS